jgi:predicted XRE-type DNA-binding protein
MISRADPIIYYPRVPSPSRPCCNKPLPSIQKLVKSNSPLPFKFIKKKTKEIANELDGEDLPKTVLQYCCQRDFSTVKRIAKSPGWSNFSISEMPNIFIKKCNACMGFCDFSSKDADYTSKNIKKRLIEDIKEALETAKYAKRLNQDTLQSFVDMFKENIFTRPYISLSYFAAFYANVCNPNDFMLLNLEWMHLDPIYKAFESFLNSNCIRPVCITSFLTKDFIHNLFEVLKHSPDKREQMAICSILLTIGHNFLSTHKMIQSEATEFLVISQFDISVQYSLSSFFEFFSVWTTIYKPKEKIPQSSSSFVTKQSPGLFGRRYSSLSSISAQSAPCSALSLSRQKYLKTNIMPLVKLDSFALFEDSFSSTVCSFIRSDKKNTDIFIDYMLKHWPVRNTKKQVAFFDSMMKVIDLFWKHISDDIVNKLVKHVTKSFADFTTQISQAALNIVTNKSFQALFTAKWDVCGPLMYKSACDSMSNHWSEDTRALAAKIMDILEKIDPSVKTSKCCSADDSIVSSFGVEVAFASCAEDEENIRNETWSVIRSMANVNN